MSLLKAVTVAMVLGAACGAARADVLKMPAQKSGSAHSTATDHRPPRGMTMAEVVHRFGQPRLKHPAVGGHAPLHPPITRWDYPGYSVFFERNLVLDSVVPKHPPKLYHVHQLEHGP